MHLSAYTSVNDVGMACGLSGWYVESILVEGEDRVVFRDRPRQVALLYTDDPALVTCVGCRAEAVLRAERRAELMVEVAAAGGTEAYMANVCTRAYAHVVAQEVQAVQTRVQIAAAGGLTAYLTQIQTGRSL